MTSIPRVMYHFDGPTVTPIFSKYSLNNVVHSAALAIHSIFSVISIEGVHGAGFLCQAYSKGVERDFSRAQSAARPVCELNGNRRANRGRI
jgi:hypothetical protein